jgi:hypothetical protein
MGGRQEEQGDAQAFRLMQAQRRVEIPRIFRLGGKHGMCL